MGKYLPILTIARCGSFNRAAGELGYSQPNLWHIVNNLEDELGTKLFHRSRQGVTLTDAGKTLLERMARIEAQESSLHEAAKSFYRNQLRVGVFPGLPGPWLAKLLADLDRARPELRVKLEMPETYRAGRRAVEEQTLDCCFSVLSASEGTDCIPLWEEPYELVIRMDHPLAGMERVRLKDVFGKVSLIPSGDCFDPDSPLQEVYRRTEHVLMADSAPLDTQFSLALAEKGLGAALMPKTTLDEVLNGYQVKRLPLSDPLYRQAALLCGRPENRPESVNALIGLVSQRTEPYRNESAQRTVRTGLMMEA